MNVAPEISRTRVGDVALSATGLVAGYGDLNVVHGIDLELCEGEVVALLGSNGAGKTTTLLTLAGELAAHAGEISWYGSPRPAGLPAMAARGLGFVPEERSVVMSMSVRDNLLLGSGGIDPAVAIFPELSGLLGRRAGLLSGGEQQMVTVARALARRPKVLLLDEISLGLAPKTVDRLFDAIGDAVTTQGMAVLLVEQQVARAVAVSDRWYLMRRGHIVAAGDSDTEVDVIRERYLTDESDPSDITDPTHSGAVVTGADL